MLFVLVFGLRFSSTVPIPHTLARHTYIRYTTGGLTWTSSRRTAPTFESHHIGGWHDTASGGCTPTPPLSPASHPAPQAGAWVRTYRGLIRLLCCRISHSLQPAVQRRRAKDLPVGSCIFLLLRGTLGVKGCNCRVTGVSKRRRYLDQRV